MHACDIFVCDIVLCACYVVLKTCDIVVLSCSIRVLYACVWYLPGVSYRPSHVWYRSFLVLYGSLRMRVISFFSRVISFFMRLCVTFLACRIAFLTCDILVLIPPQVYHLMKFDSYPRFLKSDLYRKSLAADIEGLALPFNRDDDVANREELKPRGGFLKKVRHARLPSPPLTHWTARGHVTTGPPIAAMQWWPGLPVDRYALKNDEPVGFRR